VRTRSTCFSHARNPQVRSNQANFADVKRVIDDQCAKHEALKEAQQCHPV